MIIASSIMATAAQIILLISTPTTLAVGDVPIVGDIE